jgi:hypothetical protein
VPGRRIFAPRVVLGALLSAAIAAGAAGCGADSEGPTDDTQVRATVARFGVATRNGDYQTICDQLLADALVHSVEAVGLPCESALQRGLSDVRDPRLEIRQVSMSGGRALVSVHSTAAGQPPSDDAIQLVKEGGTWRIASLAAPSPGQGSSASPSSPVPSSAVPSSAAPSGAMPSSAAPSSAVPSSAAPGAATTRTTERGQ